MATLSKEEINKAKNVSIVDYCVQEKIPLVGKGNDYYLEEHDSLRISRKENLFHWFSRNTGGDVIDFVQAYQGLSFGDAVKKLNGASYEVVNQIGEQPREPFRYYYRPQYDTTEIRNYLIDERKINKDIVESLLKHKFIEQVAHKDYETGEYSPALSYKWGKCGQVVGATIQGLKEVPLQFGKRGKEKRIVKNSEQHFGFNVTLGKPERMYVFESPVDLMSYWSLNKNMTNCMLVEMEGVKPRTVANFVQYCRLAKGVSPTEVYLGVDNDRAGAKLMDFFSIRRSVDENGEITEFHRLIPDDNAIPKDLFDRYLAGIQAQESSLSPFTLAAVHKTVENFEYSETYSELLGNGYEYRQYFSAGKDTTLSLDEAIKEVIQDFEGLDLSNKKEVIEVLKGTQYTESQALNIYEKLTYYDSLFKENGEIVSTIRKDWNDVLKDSIPVPSKLKRPETPKELQGEFGERLKFVQDKNLIKALVKRGEKDWTPFFEADSPKEAYQLANAYGFYSVDKEDRAKYFNKGTNQKTVQAKSYQEVKAVERHR